MLIITAILSLSAKITSLEKQSGKLLRKIALDELQAKEVSNRR